MPSPWPGSPRRRARRWLKKRRSSAQVSSPSTSTVAMPAAMARERVESGISRTLEAASERMAELQSRLDDVPAAERETRAGCALIAEIGATDRLAAGIEGAGERYASECELADGYATRGPAGGRDDPQFEIKTGAGRPKGGQAR